jgi:hypothetical protein
MFHVKHFCKVLGKNLTSQKQRSPLILYGAGASLSGRGFAMARGLEIGDPARCRLYRSSYGICASPTQGWPGSNLGCSIGRASGEESEQQFLGSGTYGP